MSYLTFEQFINYKVLSDAWVREDIGLQLHVRRSGLSEGTDITIENIGLDVGLPFGGGRLTEFLDRWEPTLTFYFENILNGRLIDYLIRRGYSAVPGLSKVCMRKKVGNDSGRGAS